MYSTCWPASVLDAQHVAAAAACCLQFMQRGLLLTAGCLQCLQDCLLLAPTEPFLFTAGGLPIGAVLVKQKIADVMAPGDHGSTFAGNPLVCHAANAVVDIIAEPSFLEGVTQKGERLRQGLRQALGGNPHVKEVRGLGLIVGVQLDTVSQDPGVVVVVAKPLGYSCCQDQTLPSLLGRLCAWGQQWRLFIEEVDLNCLAEGRI